MFFQPLEQFEILVFQPFSLKVLNKILSFFFKIETIFFTNSVLYTFFAIISIYFFFYVSIYSRNIFSENPWEIFLEEFYSFIYTTIAEQTGANEMSLEYFNLIFTIFIFILFANLIGLTPFAFTTTSFIIKTFLLSFGLLIGLTLIGFLIQGLHFFNLFVPSGVPKALIPMLVFIEVVSYVSRAFSLAIRLFANMMSGHSLLNILSGFCISLSKISFLLGIVPFLIILAISFLEVGIAILQAYVFVVLLCIYMNDALYGHGDEHHLEEPKEGENLLLDQDFVTLDNNYESDLKLFNLLPKENLLRSVEEPFFDVTDTVNVILKKD